MFRTCVLTLLLSFMGIEVHASDREGIVAYAEGGENEIVRSCGPIAAHRVVPKPDVMEEVVVTAQKREPLGKLRRSLVGLMMDKPGGFDLQLLPTYQPEQALVLEERHAHEHPFNQQLEPVGGILLFRLTLGRS